MGPKEKTTVTTFEAEIKPTDFSEKLSLKGKIIIFITDEGVELKAADHSGRTIHWEYNVIRRFGKGHHMFGIQVGRKSETGEGTLEINYDNPQNIYAALKNHGVKVD